NPNLNKSWRMRVPMRHPTRWRERIDRGAAVRDFPSVDPALPVVAATWARAVPAGGRPGRTLGALGCQVLPYTAAARPSNACTQLDNAVLSTGPITTANVWLASS